MSGSSKHHRTPDGRSEPDELRAQLHGMWGAVAGGWAEHAEFVDARGAAVTAATARADAAAAGRARARARLRPGRSRPRGRRARRRRTARSCISDVAPEMTAIARRAGRGARARERARPASSTSSRSTSPTRSYDVVLCREGLMLVPDPARAAREIARVLRPGGRVALAVWGPREQNPWLGIVFDTVTRAARHADAAARPPGPVLARRSPTGSPGCSPTPGSPTSSVREHRDAVPRRVGRGVVDEDGGARRPARAAARGAARARRAGALRPRARGDRRVRDADGARDPGRVADRQRHAARSGSGLAPERLAPAPPGVGARSSPDTHLAQSCDRDVHRLTASVPEGASVPPMGTTRAGGRMRRGPDLPVDAVAGARSARRPPGAGGYGVEVDVVVVSGASGGTSRYCRSNFAICANAGAATMPPQIAALGSSTMTSTTSRGFDAGTMPTNDATYFEPE